MKRSVRLSSSVLLLVVAVPKPAASALSVATQVSRPAELGHVRSILHGLAIQPPHQPRQRGKVAAHLYNKYALETRARQQASMAFRDSTILYLNERTDAVLSSPHSTRITKGEINEVLSPGMNHQVTTAAATAAAVGTNFDVRIRGKRSIYIVVSGTVSVQNKRGQVLVHQDQETTVTGNQPPTAPQPVDAQREIGWTLPLSSGGWQVLKAPPTLFPHGLGTDSAGNLYVTDYSNFRVIKFSPGGKQLLTWGTKGTQQGQFEAPWGLAVDSHDNVYVADGVRGTVQKFTSSGTFLFELGTVGVPGSGAVDFFNPDGVTIDGQDNLYVADQGNSRIQKFTADGTPVPLAAFGATGQSPNLGEPYDVAVDSAGNLYVADTGNYHVKKLAADGTLLATWGNKGTRLGEFNLPFGIAVDGAGNIFVADTVNNRIQELAPSGEPLTSWGMEGKAPGQFDQPADVFIDRAGTLFVAEGHRIQKLTGAAAPR